MSDLTSAELLKDECACGHSRAVHFDPRHSKSTACSFEGCDCEGYRKRAAQPDAVQAFAAELVRWCEEESTRLTYLGGPITVNGLLLAAGHIRSMAEGRHE